MSRLIDADALIAKMDDDAKHMKSSLALIFTYAEINDIKHQQTVDAVEVVRCKDCRHYGWTENRIPSEREWWCYEWNDAREETDFCSHAERWQDEIG